MGGRVAGKADNITNSAQLRLELGLSLTKVNQVELENLFSFQSPKNTFIGFVTSLVKCIVFKYCLEHGWVGF